MKSYYVTVIQGKRIGYLIGPLPSHEVALELVATAKRRACEIDPWLDFALFGTMAVTSTNQLPPVGKLNYLYNGAGT